MAWEKWNQTDPISGEKTFWLLLGKKWIKMNKSLLFSICCLFPIMETLSDGQPIALDAFQRHSRPIFWRQETSTLHLEFSAVVKLFWSNYEPLNEEWDRPVAGGAKKSLHMKVISGDARACVSWLQADGVSGRADLTHSEGWWHECAPRLLYSQAWIHVQKTWSHTHRRLMDHLIGICQAWWFSSVSH